MPVRLSILLLALLGTGAASAQESAPVSAQALPPPPLVPAPSGDAVSPSPFHPGPSARLLPPPESIGHRVGRVSLEVLGGALGGAVGFGAGFYAGSQFAQEVSCGIECSEGAFLTLGVVGAGMALGASAGVFGGGALLDGQGRFLHTLGGAVLAEGLLAGMLVLGLEDDAALTAFLFAPLVGALVGYEVSYVLSGPSVETPEPSRSALRVMPVVGPAPGGGVVGLLGRF